MIKHILCETAEDVKLVFDFYHLHNSEFYISYLPKVIKESGSATISVRINESGDCEYWGYISGHELPMYDWTLVSVQDAIIEEKISKFLE
jgi:hypothetical protein